MKEFDGTLDLRPPFELPPFGRAEIVFGSELEPHSVIVKVFTAEEKPLSELTYDFQCCKSGRQIYLLRRSS